MNTPTRVPAGDPRGGQFTAAHRPESGTALQRPGPTPSLRSPEHAELADLGVGQGILALLAPVEAKIVLAGAREKAPDRDAVRNHVREYLHWRDRAETGPVHEPRARRILDEATRQHDAAWVGYAAARAGAAGHEDAPTLLREAERDLAEAVKRYDAARADLQYLTDPAARTVTLAELERVDAGAFDRQAAADRFADPAYRGQVHSAPDPTPTPGDHP